MAIKDLIPYEPALELKKLGFREPCFGNHKEADLAGLNKLIEIVKKQIKNNDTKRKSK